MTAISKRQRARFYIYIKPKKCESFLYTKSKTISVTFLYTERMTLYVTQFFMKYCKFAFIYKKYDILRYLKFLYTKSLTLKKNLDNLHYVFILKTPETLCYE